MWETARTVLKPLRFIALLSTGVLTGLLLDFMLFITPALATLPGPAFVQVTQAIDKQFFEPIPWLYTVVNFSTLFVLLIMLREWRSPVFMLLTAALVCTVLATVSTLLINVPINVDVINNWSAQNPPANWAQVRDQWDQANAFRAILLVLAFTAQLVAVLLPSRSAVGAVQQAAFGRAHSPAKP
jgi:uncharacterized membrane protein